MDFESEDVDPWVSAFVFVFSTGDFVWKGFGSTSLYWWLRQKYPEVRSLQVIDISFTLSIAGSTTHPSSAASGSTNRFFRWCASGRPLLIAQLGHNQFSSPGIFVLTMKHVSPMHHFWKLQPWHARGFFAPFAITFTKIGAPSIVTSSPLSSFKKLPSMMRENNLCFSAFYLYWKIR